MMQIVGRIHLGRRIDINIWKEQYKDDREVCDRVNDFLIRHTYAMPILSFQMTKAIDLNTLRSFKVDFVCPQMYYYLEKYPNLLKFIKENAVDVGELQVNSFDNITKKEICRKQY